MGPLERLMQGYDVETDQGMDYRRPIDSMLEVAKNAGGMICLECGLEGKLFFGDPAGDHWCMSCQVVKEFGL